MKDILHEDTICALATGGSMSAIAVIRLSGNNSINIVNSIFSKKILDVKTHTIHFGTISKNNQVIDEVVVSIFRKNKSYTGEETNDTISPLYISITQTDAAVSFIASVVNF